MKITYIQLKNFASIFTGMSRTKIEIDFTCSEQKIIHIKGPNGSGKTSLLSTFHPFAYNKEDESRDNSELILEGKEGYKEIHYQDKDDKYIIRHIYQPKPNNKRTVKSFISMNGNELNANGNVTSFIEIVKDTLGIEPDFLRLLRLGPQVSSFIKLSNTQRKDFASILLSEVGIYAKMFKKVSEKSRNIKNTMKIVSEKLNRLHVIDDVELRQEIERLENTINENNIRMDEYTNEIGIYKGKINSINDSGEFRYDLNHMENTIREKEKYYNKLLSNLKTDMSTNDIENSIKSLELKYNELTNSRDMSKLVLDMNVNNLSKLYDARRDKEEILSKFTTKSDVESLEAKLNELESIKSSKYVDIELTCTVSDLEHICAIADNLYWIVNDIRSVSKQAYTYAINKRLEGRRIERWCNDNLSIISANIAKLDNKLAMTDVKPSNFIYIITEPDCNDNTCIYREFYEDHTSANKENEITKIKSEIATLERKMDFYNDILFATNKIDSLQQAININSSLINKTGYANIIDLTYILQSILNGDIKFYNENKMVERISLYQSKIEYMELDETIDKLKKELHELKSNENIIDSISNELKRIISDIEQLNSDIDKYRDEYNRYITLIEETGIEKEQMLSALEASNNKDIVENEIKNCKIEYEKALSIHEQTNQILVSINNLEVNKNKLKILNNDLNYRLEDTKYKLRDYDNLIKELNELNKQYDDIDIVRESLTNSKGIPLLFQKVYLNNIQIIANDLLNIIYNGTLSLDKFEINDSEFRIPYIKEGVIINDVSSASQGEEAFITVVMSFALIMQSIEKYNIMLLDEIDGPLDTRNRSIFLSILEKQIESINAEQVFIISHNDMFSGYHVDILDTKNEGSIKIK